MSELVTMQFPIDGCGPRPVRIRVANESAGPNSLRIKGLPEAAAREHAARIRSALAQVSCSIERCTFAIAFEPEIPSETSLDLAVAIAILVVMGKLPRSFAQAVALGELGFEGQIKPTRGVLASLTLAASYGKLQALVAEENAREAGLVEHLEVRQVCSLRDLLTQSPRIVAKRSLQSEYPTVPELPLAFGRICRQLEIAAVGGHNVLFIGPPGCRILAARALQALLPPLSSSDALKMAQEWSIAGLLIGWRMSPDGYIAVRPFRAPHCSVSECNLVGSHARVSELNLASFGVLALDPVVDFRRSAIERLARAQKSTGTILVGAADPCPCGFIGAGCRCVPEAVARHEQRLRELSIPFALRIDLRAPEAAPWKLDDFKAARERVRNAIVFRKHRILGERVAGALSGDTLERTIADLELSNEIGPTHIAEANELRGQS